VSAAAARAAANDCAPRLILLVALLVMSCSVRAALYMCVEAGQKVVRDRPCDPAVEPEPRSAEAPKARTRPADAFLSVPIFSQKLVFRLPAGWKRAHEATGTSNYVLEFLPEGESLDSWKNMISIQGFRDLARKAQGSAPKVFIDGLSARMEKQCGANLVRQSVDDMRIDSYDAHAAIVGCARVDSAPMGLKPGQSEVGYHLVIKGRNDVYVIYRAYRGEAFDKRKPPVTPADGRRFFATLQPIRLCESTESQFECWERRAR
jgi:hypothetical protein